MEVYKNWNRTAMISSEPNRPEPREAPVSRAGELPLPPLNYNYESAALDREPPVSRAGPLPPLNYNYENAALDVSQFMFAMTEALINKSATERLWHLEQTDDGAVARETVTISTNQDWTVMSL